jgi:ectoine hydroxylase-related dioxygenase (phytanoyl-CoA dioxygenase family)
MRYNEDSEHFAHYDAGFFYPDSVYRTLKSMVIYLTTNDSGATRFIDDDQSDVHVWNRKHDDWNRRVYDSEVIYSSYPQKGSVLLFDHRLCHDVQQYDGKSGDRIIIRGDIIYETII